MSDLLDHLQSALADRYPVERELGRGGMAIVYLAEDLKHGRPVAIKVLRPELAAVVGAERFLREIEIAARLRHPNILPLYDSGEAQGFLYYVMPYVQGETLRDKLSRERQLPLDHALLITHEMADGLQYAHDLGVIHRDIKPENILLDAGHAVIADFGIARAVSEAGGERLTETGIAVGTPLYMSPEQAFGEPHLDPRSDLYSLACVTYEMLAGDPPFTGSSSHAIVARKSMESAPSLRVVRPNLPVAVERAVLRALSATPADRFASVAQFLDALAGAEAALEPIARAPAVQRWAVWSVALLGIVGALALALWQFGGDGAAVPFDADVVAVLPFDATGDSAAAALGDEMVYLLSMSLDGAVGLRAVDARRVLKMVRDVGGGAVEPNMLAQRLGAGSFVTGSIVSSAGRLRIQARLLDVASGKEVASRQVTGDADDPFGIVDDLAGALIAGRYRGPTVGLSGRLTPSVDALKAYLRGEVAYLAFDTAGAFEAFGRALAIDSAFALAAYRYAMVRYRAGGTGSAEEALRLVRQAREFPERLGSVMPDNLDMLEGHILGQRDTVEQATSAILRRQPDDADAWHYLAETLFHFNSYRGRSFYEAQERFENAAQREPGYTPALLHLIELATRRSDTAEVHARALEVFGEPTFLYWSLVDNDAEFERALRSNHRFPLGLMETSHLLAFDALDPQRASRVARLATGTEKRREAQAAGYKFLAYLAFGMGQLAEARRMLDSLVVLDAPSGAVHQAYLALTSHPYHLADSLEAMGRALTRLDPARVLARTLSTDSYLESAEIFVAAQPYLQGLVAAATGDTAAASRFARQLDTLTLAEVRGTLARDLAAGVRAEIARRAGKTNQVIRILSDAQRYISVESGRESPFASQPRERFLLAEALVQADSLEAALAWFEGIMAPWMPYDVAYYAQSLKRRGELLEVMGQPDSAATLYARFLDWWAEADPELLPVVEQVRARIGRIESAGDSS